MRQWVLSVPFPLRFLFASQPAIMSQVLGIVYRALAANLIKKTGFVQASVHTGAVTLIQRFCSALAKSTGSILNSRPPCAISLNSTCWLQTGDNRFLVCAGPEEVKDRDRPE